MTSPTPEGQRVAGEFRAAKCCPDCSSRSIDRMVKYGQVSYSCRNCHTWGPWRSIKDYVSAPPTTSGREGERG